MLLVIATKQVTLNLKPKQKKNISVKFRLGICGKDEEQMALAYKANGAAAAFWYFSAEGKGLELALSRGPESLERKSFIR